MLPHPTVTPLVSEETFAAARTAAFTTRVRRHVLWKFAPESGCCALDPTKADPRMRWHRVAAHPTLEPIHAHITKTERFGDHIAWFVTEEHHDVLGNFYTPLGEKLLPSWQPGGPGLLRTADNPTHWILINCFYPCPYMAPIAVSDEPLPAGWSQPRKPHYQPESDVWVHFTEAQGPFTPRAVLTKIQAPRRTTEAMRIFLKRGTETPSAVDMTTGVLKHINTHDLFDPSDSQTVVPDDTLKALLSVTTPFRLTDLHRILEPHYGPFI
jgi:hypothetical protein